MSVRIAGGTGDPYRTHAEDTHDNLDGWWSKRYAALEAELKKAEKLIEAARAWARCDCDICSGKACEKAVELYAVIKTLK